MEENDASANPIHHSRAAAALYCCFIKYSTICFKGWLKLHAESFDVVTVIENVNSSRVENLLPPVKYLISSLHIGRMSVFSKPTPHQLRCGARKTEDAPLCCVFGTVQL